MSHEDASKCAILSKKLNSLRDNGGSESSLRDNGGSESSLQDNGGSERSLQDDSDSESSLQDDGDSESVTRLEATGPDVYPSCSVIREHLGKVAEFVESSD